jgi:hypothetical protein
MSATSAVVSKSALVSMDGFLLGLLAIPVWHGPHDVQALLHQRYCHTFVGNRSQLPHFRVCGRSPLTPQLVGCTDPAINGAERTKAAFPVGGTSGRWPS